MAAVTRQMPPPDRERRLVWIDPAVYARLQLAAAARGVSVDDLVERIVADVPRRPA